jgi:hypothetical protein
MVTGSGVRSAGYLKASGWEFISAAILWSSSFTGQKTIIDQGRMNNSHNLETYVGRFEESGGREGEREGRKWGGGKRGAEVEESSPASSNYCDEKVRVGQRSLEASQK